MSEADKLRMMARSRERSCRRLEKQGADPAAIAGIRALSAKMLAMADEIERKS